MGISDLEAVLFSAAKPISIDVIQDVFKLSKQDTLALVDRLTRYPRANLCCWCGTGKCTRIGYVYWSYT